jgi:hypothetical protein
MGILRRTPNSEFYPESLVRFQPTSVNVPENLGVIATNDLVGNRELTFLNRTTGNPFLIANQETLEKLSFPNLYAPGADILVTGNAVLSSLYAPNIGLPTSGGSLTGASLDFSDNAINQEDIDALFNRLALSLSSGKAYYTVIDTSGGTNAAPTAASSLARSSLYLIAAEHEISISVN